MIGKQKKVRSMKMSKVKVEEAEIVVHGTADKPYFEIKYREVGKKDYNIGYSSYDIRNVFGWLKSEFDIVGKSDDDTKRRILRSLLCARAEMRSKNMLTVDAMITIVDVLIYLVGNGDSPSNCEMEKPKPKPRETLLVLTSENLPKCFGSYDAENIVECGCCMLNSMCKRRSEV